jgi:hypothetical protein
MSKFTLNTNVHLVCLRFLRRRRSISSDFSYKHEARHNSTLVVTKIHGEDSDNAILEMFTDVISTAKACTSFVLPL